MNKIRYPGEKMKLDMCEHWSQIEKLDGRDAQGLKVSQKGLGWELGIIQGFVVNGGRRLIEDLRGALTAPIIPFMVGGGNTKAKREAKRKERKAKKILGTREVQLIAIPDITQPGYFIKDTWIHEEWSVGFIRKSDLFVKNPQDLKKQSKEARSQGNKYLAESLDLAYDAITWSTEEIPSTVST